MQKIILPTKEKVLLDDKDFIDLSKFRWHLGHRKSYVCSSVYRKDRGPKTIYMHREIVKAQYGDIVDHINGNTFDNRRCNLRICSAKGNARNRRLSTRNTSGFKGVSWWKSQNSWVAQIIVDYKRIFLGYFKDKKEAAKAYNLAAIEYFGQFANLNKI